MNIKKDLNMFFIQNGIKNEYDQGWYDYLKMIEIYFNGDI